MYILKEFSLKNFKSFKDQNSISFVAENIKEYEEENIMKIKDDRILNILTIYGKNGTGKSNIIKALLLVKNYITQGLFLKDKILNELESFKFSSETKNSKIEFNLHFFTNKNDYFYSFEIENKRIIKEKLSKKDLREIIIFDRKSSNWKDTKITQKYLNKSYLDFIPEKFKNESNLILNLLISNESITGIFNEIRDFFDNLLIISDKRNNNYQNTYDYLDKRKEEGRDKISKLMKKYELGIKDFIYEKKDSEKNVSNIMELKKILPQDVIESVLRGMKEESFNIKLTETNVKMHVTHDVYDENKELKEEVILNFDKYTSEGTKKLYSLAGAIYKVLENGGVLVIDELDGLIHTFIVEDIINMFKVENNYNNSQLLYSGHNPYLVLSNNLRRDQIVMIKKNKFSESIIKKLSDYKNVKPNNSFMKKYLEILKD